MSVKEKNENKETNENKDKNENKEIKAKSLNVSMNTTIYDKADEIIHKYQKEQEKELEKREMEKKLKEKRKGR